MIVSKFFKYFYPAILALSLTACVSNTINTTKLLTLEKGQSIENTIALLEEKPYATHQMDGYTFLDYHMIGGGYNTPYVMAYKNGQLVYWGYLYEFNRLADEQLRKAIQQVYTPAANLP